MRWRSGELYNTNCNIAKSKWNRLGKITRVCSGLMKRIKINTKFMKAKQQCRSLFFHNNGIPELMAQYNFRFFFCFSSRNNLMIRSSRECFFSPFSAAIWVVRILIIRRWFHFQILNIEEFFQSIYKISFPIDSMHAVHNYSFRLFLFEVAVQKLRPSPSLRLKTTSTVRIRVKWEAAEEATTEQKVSKANH